MRKTILSILAAASLASCSVKQPEGVLQQCVVTRVTSEYQYSWAPDRIYKIENDCGYNLSSKRLVEVGDTIQVLVVDAKNYFHK
jgi:hypothetical protein